MGDDRAAVVELARVTWSARLVESARNAAAVEWAERTAHALAQRLHDRRRGSFTFARGRRRGVRQVKHAGNTPGVLPRTSVRGVVQVVWRATDLCM